MKHFTDDDAVALIKAALESKAITLESPGKSDKSSEETARFTATYLLTLLNQLTGAP